VFTIESTSHTLRLEGGPEVRMMVKIMMMVMRKMRKMRMMMMMMMMMMMIMIVVMMIRNKIIMLMIDNDDTDCMHYNLQTALIVLNALILLMLSG
jgi:hypothetical protein